jgi:hypothetical protein
MSMGNLPASVESLHNSFVNAGKLAKARVIIAVVFLGGRHGIYARRFSLGNGVANGMNYGDILAAVTANVADIFYLDTGRLRLENRQV